MGVLKEKAKRKPGRPKIISTGDSPVSIRVPKIVLRLIDDFVRNEEGEYPYYTRSAVINCLLVGSQLNDYDALKGKLSGCHEKYNHLYGRSDDTIPGVYYSAEENLWFCIFSEVENSELQNERFDAFETARRFYVSHKKKITPFKTVIRSAQSAKVKSIEVTDSKVKVKSETVVLNIQGDTVDDEVCAGESGNDLDCSNEDADGDAGDVEGNEVENTPCNAEGIAGGVEYTEWLDGKDGIKYIEGVGAVGVIQRVDEVK